MTCPHCNNPVPEGQMFCLPCYTQRAAAEMRPYQYEFLRKVHTGQWALLCYYVPKSGTHLSMFGAMIAFCGYSLVRKNGMPIPIRKDNVPYTDVALGRVCSACAKEVRIVMAEALAAVAP